MVSQIGKTFIRSDAKGERASGFNSWFVTSSHQSMLIWHQIFQTITMIQQKCIDLSFVCVCVCQTLSFMWCLSLLYTLFYLLFNNCANFLSFCFMCCSPWRMCCRHAEVTSAVEWHATPSGESPVMRSCQILISNCCRHFYSGPSKKTTERARNSKPISPSQIWHCYQLES